jgi:hypothetical protein
MSVNGISNVTQSYDSNAPVNTRANQASSAEHANQTEAPAAVYEKSDQTVDTTKATYTRDQLTIDRLKSEADRRYQSLRDLVQKLLLKQGSTYSDATDIYQLLREGKVEVDDETRAQAQKDIAEDGYWGVEQTSNRLVEFAKALSGGDRSKADELINAVKKGFEQATKAWGGSLPEISRRTIDATISKLEAWRDGKETSNIE